MSFTIGSLFDGSGGFPLAAFLCEGTPVWASEVEPYPIAVTKTRFPYMKHLGSVTDIKGNEVEPVDVITFGSPCQDLSVAGKRAGLKHTDNGDDETTRSGLFMEAVRIIKEMREATGGKSPRFALWENVPGAFSSNKGEDFRVVCEELIKVVEPTAVMPAVPQKGWNYADLFCGDGWSLAYRVLDAQYWGVPQRRRRIYLVLDLGGERAGEVLFEREGLRGYFAEGRTPWETAPGDAENRTGTADCEGKCYGIDHVITTGGNCSAQGSCVYENIEATLKAGGPHAVAYGIVSKGNGEAWPIEEKHMALSCGGGQAGQGYPCVMEPLCMATQQGGAEIMEDKCPTITAAAGMSGNNQPVVCYSDMVLDDQGGSVINVRTDGKSPTLRAQTGGHLPIIMEAAGFCTEHSAKSRTIGYEEEISPTLRAGVVPAVVFDARGNGDGAVAPTITGDHNNRVTDYTCVVLEGNGSRPSHRGDGYRESETMYTLNTTEQHAVCVPIHDQATRFSGKRGENYDGKGNGMGVGEPGDPANTLTGGDRHAVAYSLETFHCTSEENMTTTLKARDYKDPVCVAYGVDCRNSTEYPDLNGCIQHDTYKNLNSNGVVRVEYIVRRLTPTECARLQGFADRWATPDMKSEFSDEEYRFWLNVRNTHAEINGKAVKEYTKDQMLTWYNKLHTDSSEYKLWGNGIALPTALYVMQGIADVMKGATKND